MTWYDYCKSITEEYPEAKIYQMNRTERNELRTELIQEIIELTSSDFCFEERSIIKDQKKIGDVIITNTWHFPTLIEKLEEPDQIWQNHDLMRKIIYPSYEWGRVIKERHERNVDKTAESDYEYFKFLRSICAVHPIGTDGHEHYLKKGSACAFTDHELFNPSMVVADYYATIYRADGDTTIPIKVSQIIRFLEQSFNYLSREATSRLKTLSAKEIEDFKKKKIKQPEDDYNLYLKILRDAVKTRYGDMTYIVDHWIRIFNTQYTDPVMNKNLDNYKEWLKKKIQISHEEIQNMEWKMNSWNCSFYGCDIPFIQPYNLEKIEALYMSEEVIEDIWKHHDDEFLNEGYRQKTMFDLHLIWSAELVESKEANRVYYKLYNEMDGREFARYQLSKLHSLIENMTGIVIRYEYDDWYLYMQYVVASWIYKTNNKLLPNH